MFTWLIRSYPDLIVRCQVTWSFHRLKFNLSLLFRPALAIYMSLYSCILGVSNQILASNIHVLDVFQLWTVALCLTQPMAKLVTLVGRHLDRQPPTVVTQATTWWETVLTLVKLQECGLGVHLPVSVCCY